MQRSRSQVLFSFLPQAVFRHEDRLFGQVSTVDGNSHIVIRTVRAGQEDEFVTRYGDSGEDEFDGRGGTIPQRLIMMNGKLVSERVDVNPFNASARIAWMASDNPKAVEAAYFAVLSRRPTATEAAHFESILKNGELTRAQHLQDLYWALVNSTEFSWNH